MTDLDRVRLFNKYFHSVFTSSSYVLPSLDDLSTPETSLSNVDISISDVFQALCTLDINKAPGIDSVSPMILKYCAAPVANPIHYLLSLSLRSQSLPQEWRTHSITPIFKSGDKSSLLCIIFKVLEKLVFQQVFNFLQPSSSVWIYPWPFLSPTTVVVYK